MIDLTVLKLIFQVGFELMNMLVRWENDFDSTEMEMLRKRSLCNVLSSKMEGNVEFLCSMFPKESTRVPQQSLIVDVLSTAASEASLANLQILAKGLTNFFFFNFHNLIFFRKSLLYLFIKLPREEKSKFECEEKKLSLLLKREVCGGFWLENATFSNKLNFFSSHSNFDFSSRGNSE